MVKRRTDRTARQLAERLDRASEIIPTIRDHLDEQRRHVAYLAAAGGGGRQPGTHADPTARTATELDRIHRLERYIDDMLGVVRTAINELDVACRDALGHRAPAPSGDPVCHIADCHDYVAHWTRTDGTIVFRMSGEYAGLCSRHRIAAQRGTLDRGTPGTT